MNERAKDGLLRVSEAARRLGVSPPTVYRLMDSGDLVYVRVGQTARRIDPADVEAFIQRRKTTQQSCEPA